MRPLVTRWRVKGKLKLILILLFAFSLLFMSYQLLYYASLNEYQTEESEAHLRQKLLFKPEPERKEDRKLKGEPSIRVQTHNKVQTVGKVLRPVLPKKEKPLIRPGKPVSSNVLGVAPEYWSRYTSNSLKFTCFTSKNIKISWEKVNDDYCDCPSDGSDEPSTSACMNGKFYCTKSIKPYPEYVPSSRVNDGICDCCCDCSDEFLTKQLKRSTSCTEKCN